MTRLLVGFLVGFAFDIVAWRSRVRGLYKWPVVLALGYNISLPRSLWDHHMSFIFHAQYGLFTYAHSEQLDPFAIVEHFGGLGAECIVASERYPTGEGIHYHVFADFGRKFRSRRAGCFDVAGFHPNIVASRGTPEAGYDYTVKDGDIVAGGLERPSGVESVSRAAKWDIIVNAETREEFFQLLQKLDPKSLVCSHRSCVAYADWKYRVDPAPYATPNGVFDLAEYGDLSEWAAGLSNPVGGR